MRTICVFNLSAWARTIACILLVIYCIGLLFFGFAGVTLGVTGYERRSLTGIYFEDNVVTKNDTIFSRILDENPQIMKDFNEFLKRDTIVQSIIWLDFFLCIIGIIFAVILLLGAQNREVRKLKIWFAYGFVVILLELPITIVSFMYSEDNQVYSAVIEIGGYALHGFCLWIVYSLIREIKTEAQITTVPYKLTH